MKTPGLISAIALACIISAGAASAQTALKDVAHVRDGIIDVGMAYELSEHCDSIRARLFRGLGFLQSLKSHASDLGFTDEEIDDYVNDRNEKKRLEAIARAKLVTLGVVEGEEASYCAVGRAQIAANTRVGWLLR
ncbi:DUF5333 domain-containing protein [Yoonia sp.]|nr:DUF5333 domain-containing protein [Yoonia sp.]MDC1399318.1 DUF5333 domain-containing protein [Yoonia sp.]